MQPKLSVWKPHLLALSALALLAALYSWPLLSNLTSAIPGRPDFPDVTEFIWNTGWVRQALTGDEALLYTEALFVPFGADLRLSAFGLLQGLLAYPFTSLLGVIGAYNLILILTLFLNGAVAYALFHRQTRHPVAALIAATWLMLAATLLGQLSVGRTALGSLWIVTGSLLILMELLERPQLWKGLLLGLLLTAALVTDFQILLFSAIWLALYAGYWFWKKRAARPFLPALLIALLTVSVPFMALYFPFLANAETAGYGRPTFSDMSVYSFSLEHYLTPGLWWAVAGGYELVVAVVAAVLVFRWRGPYRFWLAGSAVFLVLALGPYLQPTQVPLPFAALSLWPPLGQFRTPARLVIPAVIGLSMVAALVLAHLMVHLRSRNLVLLLVLAALTGRLFLANARTPFVVQTYPDYSIYRQLGTEPGEFTLLEVPFGIRSGLRQIGAGGEVVQYYQHIHGKRLLNGSLARLPDQLFDFYRSYPSLLFLSGEPVPDMSAGSLDRDFSEVLRWSGARYVLVHHSMLDAAQTGRIERFLDRQPALHRQQVENDLVLYRVIGLP